MKWVCLYVKERKRPTEGDMTTNHIINKCKKLAPEYMSKDHWVRR